MVSTAKRMPVGPGGESPPGGPGRSHSAAPATQVRPCQSLCATRQRPSSERSMVSRSARSKLKWMTTAPSIPSSSPRILR